MDAPLEDNVSFYLPRRRQDEEKNYTGTKKMLRTGTREAKENKKHRRGVEMMPPRQLQNIPIFIIRN